MKNLKKVLALVVALTMVFTTVAFASYPDVDAAADYAGAVELLSALEVLQGDENGNFNPDNTITRAEFAAVVCRALGLEGSAASAKGATMFTDVAADHWASGYINLASQQGIVNGKGNGIFDPEGNVTYAEAVKMLVVAIGYEPMAATKGGYPAGYLSVANSTKMTAGVAGASDVAALRSTVAMLTANALEIPVMDQTAYGSETKYEPLDDYDNYTSLLTNMDVYKATGVIADIDAVEGEFSLILKEASDDYAFGWINSYTTEDFTDETDEVLTFDIGTSNVAGLLFESVDVYVQKTGRSDYVALIAVPSGVGETLTVNASDLDVATIGTTTWEYFETVDASKTTKIYVSGTPKIVVNKSDVTKYFKDNAIDDICAKYGTADASVKFVENTDDKYFDIVEITVYQHAIVDEVIADKDRIEFLDGTKVSFDPDDDEQIVNIYNAEGAEIALADIQAGDVLAMVVCDDNNGVPVKASNFDEKIAIYNLGASSVTGTVDGANEKEGYILIDSVEYEYNSTFVSEKEFEDLFKGGTEAKLGTEGTFYLGITGKIIGFAGVEGTLDNYAFILQGAKSDSTWDPCYQLKLLLADGSIVTYDIDDEVDVIEGKSEDTLEYGVDQDFAIDSWEVEYAADKAAQKAIEDKVEGAEAYTYKFPAYKRVIDFKANSKGVITEITYVYKDSKDDADYTDISGEYKESTTRLAKKPLASDIVIFNVDVNDDDDAAVVGLDSLVDEGEYAGYLLVMDDEYGVFVMTSGDAKFDAEGHVYVVDSVASSTYGDDKEKATTVTYYVDGTNTTATAIFVDGESNKVGSIDFSKLAKGSIFVANVAADGLVNNYAVLANVNEAGTGYDSVDTTVYGSDDDLDFVTGLIKEVNGSTITIEVNGEDDYYKVKASAAQYYYNTESKKAKVEAGDWNIGTVDDAGEDGANYVFMKLYNGEVTDIITFSARVK